MDFRSFQILIFSVGYFLQLGVTNYFVNLHSSLSKDCQI